MQSSIAAARHGEQSALAPIRHPTCVADVGSVVAARVQSAPLAAQEVNLGAPDRRPDRHNRL
ncbi:hypothetical protein GT929_06910 [Bifidobacterium pseudocatenulatum]|nr:hypothetical protein [Bifidobacterium pseudocatenulatum]MZM08927.1 hypothetical protein [Bifidobacterium pseudocatenulatum]MZM12175.1 hypothetical protein [Bifidobacterium pseudocatenulatum]MZM25822.1 hypothetical protein [Bifidobacterium pseudocatenulatum]MZM27522.1 hypothetical protein [Bifidobacterium pseudocatenulatum]